MTGGAGWTLRRRAGRAEALHDPEPPDEPRRTVDLLEVDAPTMVLGSGQADSVVDGAAAAAAGIAVARRRSGGGAVLLVPGDHVWIDVWLPGGDALWHDDVIRAASWLGDVWATAATGWGAEDVVVHRTNATRDGWAPVVCFAGSGPGEVFAGGRKLVGVSQRRSRAWTRFQCVVHRRWDAATTFGLLTAAGAAEAAAAWRDRIGEVGDIDVASAFLAALDAA